MKNDIKWAQSLVERFARQNIMVVGDMMLDRYIYGAVTRISPEAPVPVVRVGDEKNMAGGAANVARNVSALGGRVYMRGVVGRDATGDDLLHVLKDERVCTRGVLRYAGIRTTVKTRILAERQQIVRVDREDRLLLPAKLRSAFCAGLSAAVRSMSGVIIADYAKGTIGQDVVNAVMRVARSNAIPVALKKAKPGTKEFRAALRDALEATKELAGAHGVFNMSASDHLGFDQRARVMVKIEGGKWKLAK